MCFIDMKDKCMKNLHETSHETSHEKSFIDLSMKVTLFLFYPQLEYNRPEFSCKVELTCFILFSV